MVFKSKPADEVVPDSPELLMDALPRRRGAPSSLWSHQADLLREYAKKRTDTRDLAIELPTGTGKTLTGLLIAEWWRRRGKGSVVFACPTRQLVSQVVTAAVRQGIPVVDLSGSSKAWTAATAQRYQAGDAVGVVTYGAIFNTSPKLGSPSLLVLDDAHAGEQYVASAHTLTLNRWQSAELWEDVVEVIRPHLDRELHSRLVSTTPDTGSRRVMEAVHIGRYPDVADALTRLFARKLTTGPESFHYAAIAGHLRACAAYISWSEIAIRPPIAPTFENALFMGAEQRLYLSATLGNGGELERAFGRPEIKRLSQAPTAPTPRSGRRFVVFPQLVEGRDPVETTRDLIARSVRAVVLTPSEHDADEAAQRLVPAGWTVFRKADVEAGFEKFASTEQAVCILANRYDGLDFPGESCRVVVIAGHPVATTLHERFLAERARANTALAERLRSRMIQATGRCTRGPEDWALVVVSDPDSTNYLSRRDVQRTLDQDLQAEVQFGIEQSKTSKAEMLENADVFLQFGDEWSRTAEPVLNEYRSSATREKPQASVALADASKHEVLSAQAAWHADWATASTEAVVAADSLQGNDSVRPYKGVLEFTAAVHRFSDFTTTGTPSKLTEASSLAARAVMDATPTTWMKGMLPFPGGAAAADSAEDESAVAVISDRIGSEKNPSRFRAELADLQLALAERDHAVVEPALAQLGKLLGADAFKPSGDGRCDSAWCWGNSLWITIEAKTEQGDQRGIGMEDVRQTNAHLTLLASDRDRATPPSSSVSVILSPRESFVGDGVTIAAPHLFHTLPSEVVELSADVTAMWEQLLTLRNIKDDASRRKSTALIVAQSGLLPGSVLERLTTRQVNPVAHS